MGRVSLRPQVSRRWGVIRTIGLLGLLAGLSTCGPGADCLTSSGKVVTERRELPDDLISVYTYDNIDLTLVQDATGAPYAEVKAGENLIGDIKTTIQGRELSLTNTASCNWARSYDSPCEVTLHVPKILNVFLRGAGNIRTASTFRQDTIFFHLWGAGDMNLDVESNYVWGDSYDVGDFTIRGHTQNLLVFVEGGGRFFGQNLQTRDCYYKSKRDSNGDAYVTATESLRGIIYGNGTLFYSGQPAAITVEDTGRGQAKPAP